MGWLRRLGLVLAVVVSACTSVAHHGGDEGDCPDVSGSFTITQHCEADFVGDTLSMTQTGCELTVPLWDMTGTVSSAGRITISGSPGGDFITCEGTVTGNSFVTDCNNTCHVEGTRAGGDV